MLQVQFSLMRLTQSAASEAQIVSMKPADESSQSCSFKWMVSNLILFHVCFKTAIIRHECFSFSELNPIFDFIFSMNLQEK